MQTRRKRNANPQALAQSFPGARGFLMRGCVSGPWDVRNLAPGGLAEAKPQHLQLPPLGSGNLRARPRGNTRRGSRLEPRDLPTTAHSPGPGGAGAGAVGPEKQRDARFRPAQLRQRPRRPHNPLLAPGTGGAGRGGAGRAGGNNFLFGPLCPSPLAAGQARMPEAGRGSGNALPWQV